LGSAAGGVRRPQPQQPEQALYEKIYEPHHRLRDPQQRDQQVAGG